MYLPTVIGYLVPTYPPVTEVRVCNITFAMFHVIIKLWLFIIFTIFVTVLVGT